MIGYASRTGTRRNLAALRAAGWRLLVSARGVLRTEGFAYGLDNGAWTAFQRGESFDEAAFRDAVDQLAIGADFVVAPDIVAGGLESLRYSIAWLPWCLQRTRRVLIAVQDGVDSSHVAPLLGSRVGVAIGGSTEWKEAQLGRRVWAGVPYLHVLRVNSARRVRLCAATGADSFDGSGPSRFAQHLPIMEAARSAATAQGVLPW